MVADVIQQTKCLTRSTPAWARLCNDCGQVVHTFLYPVTKQCSLVLASGQWSSAAGKVTAGQASQWPCVYPAMDSRTMKARWVTQRVLPVLMNDILYLLLFNVTFQHKEQVSAVTDEPARRAASRQTCCKQRWTMTVINLRLNELSWQRLRPSTFSSYSELFVESRQFQPIRLRLAPLLGWPCLSFDQIFGITRLESLGCRVALFAWSYV